MIEDDFVDFLAIQGRSGVAALHQFRLTYSAEGNQLHVFLEGDDDALFYLPHLRSKMGKMEIFTYYCGGKWGVIDARDLIESDGGIDDCVFFIDRDYDDFFGKQPSPHHRTYITETYSIENMIVGTEPLEVVLLDLARMSKADPAHQLCTGAWAVEHRQFVAAIKPLLAWSLAMRAASKKPNFNNVDLSKIICRSGEKWKRAPNGFTEFQRATVRSGETVSASDVRSWLKKLESGLERQWVRGKYDLWFFETFLLRRLTSDGVKAKRWIIPPAIRDRRPFDVLGPRIAPPASLLTFLDTALISKAA